MSTASFKKTIKTRRKLLGYTLIDMEELTGITERTIRKMEKGDIKGRLENWVTLLDILGMQLEITHKKTTENEAS